MKQIHKQLNISMLWSITNPMVLVDVLFQHALSDICSVCMLNSCSQWTFDLHLLRWCLPRIKLCYSIMFCYEKVFRWWIFRCCCCFFRVKLYRSLHELIEKLWFLTIAIVYGHNLEYG